MNKKLLKFILSILLILIYNNMCYSNEKNQLHIAVSSNFLSTIKIISKNFEKKNKCHVIISSDSTANLFTKISNGAPFDIFISADAKHPKLLEKENNKSLIYAYGKLAIWKKNNFKKNTLIKLKKIKYLGLANPKLSPYGKASQITYNNINIKNNKFIIGTNINQTFYFIHSENNDIGIVALSQLIHNKTEKNQIWKIPKYLYPKIEQRIILLNNEKKNILKIKFIHYIQQTYTKNIIKKYGYKIINTND